MKTSLQTGFLELNLEPGTIKYIYIYCRASLIVELAKPVETWRIRDNAKVRLGWVWEVPLQKKSESSNKLSHLIPCRT